MKKKPVHPISEAVRELRTALGETQQDFAYRMHTAIRTIARWETVQPPRGETLVEMSRLAERGAKRPDLAAKFDRMYTAQISLDPFGQRSVARNMAGADGSHFGFLAQWFEDRSEISYGNAFRRAMSGLRSENSAYRQRCEEALQRLVENMEGKA